MRRTGIDLSKALSPYAQALKHVALRGSAAFGPSAHQMDVEMHAKGVLPADYKPPVQGAWDDTVERWAYSWQFPAEEEGAENDAAFLSKDVARLEALKSFVISIDDGAGQMTSTTPSKPPVAEASVNGDINATALQSFDAERTPLPVRSREENFLEDFASITSPNHNGESPSLSSLPSMQAVPASDVPAGMPVAYTFDGSHLSLLSLRFGKLLTDTFGLSFDEAGILTVLQALCYVGDKASVSKIFDLAGKLGFAMNAAMYNALIYVDAQSGEVSPVMQGIEQMKEAGVTPIRSTWHLLMVAFTKAGDFPAVIQVVDNMKSYACIEPDETTFALQLWALSKDRSRESNVAEAIQLFDQMENVYGFIAARPHYHSLMSALATRRKPEYRERIEHLGSKMELLGIPWNSTTLAIQLRTAQLFADVPKMENLFSKARNENIPLTPICFAWAIRGFANTMSAKDYDVDFKSQGISPVGFWIDQVSRCFEIYDLVIQRNQEIAAPIVDALMFSCVQAVKEALQHTPDDTTTILRFEQRATEIWEKEYEARGAEKSVFSHHIFIDMLASLQRIDEAERLFQDLVLAKDHVPIPRTYEVLMFMHLSSGEEGGTARALQYMDAMERNKMHISAGLLKRFVRVNNEAGYKRDMKRRARRIMQAREEYLARQREGDGFAAQPFSQERSPSEAWREESTTPAATVLRPLPLDPKSTLAWWQRWKEESVSKHELFDVECVDGMPRGETDSDRKHALQQLGIVPAEIPNVGGHKLAPKLRTEGELSGSLWSLDGGELAYPADGGGPNGWGVRLWRERRIVQTEFNKILDGKGSLPELSPIGNAARVATDQLAIEEGKVRTPGQLRDLQENPQNVFDDGTFKSEKEVALDVAPSSELVWQRERADPLAPFKSDDELSLEAENTFFEEVRLDSHSKLRDAIVAIKNKQENEVEVVGSTLSKRGKYDYLERWREMYTQGTLEVPDEPLVSFGRSTSDQKETLAKTMQGWIQKHKAARASKEFVSSSATNAASMSNAARREEDADISKSSMESSKRRRRFKSRK